jgi:hypothetical protein
LDGVLVERARGFPPQCAFQFVPAKQVCDRLAE